MLSPAYNLMYCNASSFSSVYLYRGNSVMAKTCSISLKRQCLLSYLSGLTVISYMNSTMPSTGL